MKTNLTPEGFNAALAAVQFHILPNLLVVNYDSSGQSVQGQLMYSEGLYDLIGTELVSYGIANPEDVLGTAQLMYANFPRGFALDVHDLVVDLIAEAAIAEGRPLDNAKSRYRQYVVDESALEEDKEEVNADPLWVPEGGMSLLDDPELQSALNAAQDAQQKKIHDRMETLRDSQRAKIKELGFTIMGIFDPTGATTSFLYTIGLTLKGLPELIISSKLDPQAQQDFVAFFAKNFIKDGAKLMKMDNVFTLEDDSAYGLRVVEVDPYAACDLYLVQAAPVLKEPVRRVMWIQISDAQGRFEGDEGFDNKFDQRVIAPVIAK